MRVRWRDSVRSARSVGALRPRVRSPRRSSWRLTCPLVLASSSSLLAGSPDRVSTLSRPSTRPGIRPVIRDGRLEEPTIRRGSPSPFGCRRSLLGNPVPAGEFFPPRGRLTGRDFPPGPRRGLPRSARMSCDRGGAPSPPGTAVLPRPSRLLDGACRSAAASPYTPPQLPIDGGSLTRHQRGFTQFTRPVFPSPAAARMERAAARLSPELRTPPTRSRRRTPRWGQANEHGPGTTRSTSHRSILQSVVHSQCATSRRTTSRSSPRSAVPHACLRQRMRESASMPQRSSRSSVATATVAGAR